MSAIESLRGITPSRVFERKRLSKISPEEYENLNVSELEKVKIQKIIEVLGHPELERLVKDDLVTFAMIKPKADENLLKLNDIEASKAIQKEIKKRGLDVVFDISIRFSEEDVEAFYAGSPKTSQLTYKPNIYKDKFATRWEELKDLMINGPTTIMLIYSPDGFAVEKWRDAIGSWDVDYKRDRKTIRGKYAKSNYTSIVHGSDSTQTALREIDFLKRHLERFL